MTIKSFKRLRLRVWQACWQLPYLWYLFFFSYYVSQSVHDPQRRTEIGLLVRCKLPIFSLLEIIDRSPHRTGRRLRSPDRISDDSVHRDQNLPWPSPIPANEKYLSLVTSKNIWVWFQDSWINPFEENCERVNCQWLCQHDVFNLIFYCRSRLTLSVTVALTETNRV